MNIKIIISFSVMAVTLLSSGYASIAAETLTIDHSQILKKQNSPLIGENMNYLLSSDSKMPRNVSMKQRAEEMKLSFLRFPYGRLGDNYLFTDAPYNDGEMGLTPRVASLGAPPGGLYWAVDDDGYFKQALDFDEYMSYIDKTGAEPLIMVNMLSYDEAHYPDTVVSFDDLLTHATEWVKYANITRGYNVKYWQLGNEVKSHTDKESYFANFVTMAKALKAVDPTILIGFGEDGRANWVKDALADPIVSQYIDFISPHQYLHNTTWTESYEDWRDYTGSIIPKIDKLQNYINNSPAHADLPMIVTEYGINGGSFAEEDPTGPRFFQVLNDSTVVAKSSDGSQLVKTDSVTDDSNMITMTMLDDTWFTLSFDAASPIYITAQPDPLQPVTANGTTITDAAKWRLREKNKNYYLESKLHPGKYLSFDATLQSYVLGTDKKWQAEVFVLKWKYQLLPKPNLWFPRDTKRMIQAVSSKKFVGVKPDNSLKADVFRSESSAYQFVMTDVSEKFGSNAVTLQMQDSIGGYLSSEVGLQQLLPWNKATHLTHNNKSAGLTLAAEKSKGRAIGLNLPQQVMENLPSSLIQKDLQVVRNQASNPSDKDVWLFRSKPGYYQLESYAEPGNFLMVNAEGKLTANGSVTDTNTRFGHTGLPDPNPQPAATKPEGNFGNDLWKSLMFADMSLSASSHKNLQNLIHWNTHTSFDGKHGGYHNISNSLENTPENKLTPVGLVLKVLNTHMLTNILDFPDVAGKTRVKASVEPTTGEMSIIVLNKNDVAEDFTITLPGYLANSNYSRWVYSGQSPEDEYPTFIQDDDGKLNTVSINGNQVTTSIPATSLTVIRLVDPQIAQAPVNSTIRFTSAHSGKNVGLNNSPTEPYSLSNEIKANRAPQFDTLSGLFKVHQTLTGSVKLQPLAAEAGDMLRYFASAQTTLESAPDAGSLSEWHWELNDAGLVLLESLNHSNKFMRTSAKDDFKLDRDGGKGTWSQYQWQTIDDVPLGQTIWLRSQQTNQLVYVDTANNLYADDNLPADKNAHQFVLERISGDFVALRSKLTGQYIRTGDGAGWQVKANGDTTNISLNSLFKIKLSNDLVLFESAAFSGKHLKVKVAGDKSLDSSGGASGWAQFYFGTR